MLHGCVVLLGSATPSIQSYYHVTKSKFKAVSLKTRVEKRPLPEVTLVDLSKKRHLRGTRRFITPELYKAMEKTLGSGQQVLLFLNRRGFAGFPVCSACGAAVRCKNCDISLTFHQSSNAYLCHYCGYTRFSNSNCAACGSSHIKNIGWGTEKVEAAVKTLFPTARVARMDRDTTRRKGAILSFLKGLKKSYHRCSCRYPDRRQRARFSEHYPGWHHLCGPFPQFSGFSIRGADFPAFGASGREVRPWLGAGQGDPPNFQPGSFQHFISRKAGFQSVLRQRDRFSKITQLPAFLAHDPVENFREG